MTGDCRDSEEEVASLFWEFPEVAFSAGSIGPLAALAEASASPPIMTGSLWRTTSKEISSTPRAAVAIKWKFRRSLASKSTWLAWLPCPVVPRGAHTAPYCHPHKVILVDSFHKTIDTSRTRVTIQFPVHTSLTNCLEERRPTQCTICPYVKPTDTLEESHQISSGNPSAVSLSVSRSSLDKLMNRFSRVFREFSEVRFD